MSIFRIHHGRLQISFSVRISSCAGQWIHSKELQNKWVGIWVRVPYLIRLFMKFHFFNLVSYIFERLVITKGQIQTPPYRFLAKQGGYAWVQTQATVVSVSNQYFRSQAVVCIHTRLRCVRYRSHSVVQSQHPFVSWHTYWYFCSTVTLRSEIKFFPSASVNTL